MKKCTFFVVVFVALLCSLCLVLSSMAGVTPEELTQIQKAIREQGLSWTAGENAISRMDDAEFRAMLMHVPPPAIRMGKPRIESADELRKPAASSFSWGDSAGHNWMTPVRMQSSCGACWAFAIAGMMEPRWRIANNQYNLPVDLSEQFMISCWGAGCGGGSIYLQLDSMKKYGCPDEACFPYVNWVAPCSNKCADWQSRVFRMHSHGYLWLPTVTAIKHEIQYHGPVAAFLMVYHDFRTYAGGVYKYSGGYLEGEHQIVLYGWNDADSCWFGKNSWDTTWGEAGPDGKRGWFRIKMWSDASMLQDSSWIQKDIQFGDYARSDSFDIRVSLDTSDMFFVRQADLDGDRLSDFVYTGRNADSLYIIYGNRTSTIDRQKAYFRIKRAALALGYVNADSALDVVAYNGSVLYRLLRNPNNAQARLYTLDSQLISPIAHRERLPSSSSYPAVAVGYFNNDTYLDVVASPNHLLIGDGTGSYPTNVTLPFSFDAVGVADYDEDGHDDLVCVVGDSAVIYRNDGQGTLTRTSAVRIGYRTFDAPDVIADVDWNGDGSADWIAVTSRSTTGFDTTVITVGVGDGAGGVARSDTLTVYGSAPKIVACNSNSDLYPDFAVMNATTQTIYTFVNDGHGNFTLGDTIPLVGGSQFYFALASADLDRDGNADFLSGGEIASVVQLAINQRPDRPVLPYQTQPLTVSAYDNVAVRLIDPGQFELSRIRQTIAAGEFRRSDFDANSHLDQKLIDNNLVMGEYHLILHPYPGDQPTGPVTMDIRIDGAQRARIFKNYTGGFQGYGGGAESVNRSSDSMIFYYQYDPVSPITPANGFPYYMSPPKFCWLGLVPPATPQTRYHFQLDRYFDFRSPIFDDDTLTKPRYEPATNLGQDSIFYWHVRTFDGVTWGDFSRTFAAYIGSPCCVGVTGNVDGEGIVDLSDLSKLIAYLLDQGACGVAICTPEANVNGKGIIDLSDLSLLISYLTIPGTVHLPDCK